ncbi:MAG: TonB-dependent receptor [Alphaproteobacteria bacterium]
MSRPFTSAPRASARAAGVSHRVIAWAAFGAGAAMLPQAAAAQAPVQMPGVSVTAPPPNEYRTEELSSPKARVPILDTPQAITVIPERILQEQGTTRLTDALRNVPGITLNAGEGGSQGDSLTLRGFSARGDIFRDGMRDLGSYSRDSFNIEAVEVLKGPSAVAYGRGSTGGVINQVSKSPRWSNSNEASLSVGSNTMVRGTADANYVFSPNAAIRLNAMGETSEVEKRDEVRTRRWGFAPSGTFRLGDATEITVSYIHQQDENIPDYGLPYLFGKPAKVSRENFYGLTNFDYEDTRADIVTAKVRHRFNENVSVTNQTRYGQVNRDNATTAPRIAGTPTVDTLLSDIQVNRSRVVRDRTEEVFLNQTDVAIDFRTGFAEHKVSTGIEFGREINSNKSFSQTGIPATSLISPNPKESVAFTTALSGSTKATADTFGIYATDTVKLGEMFELIGGIRWDRFDADVENRLTNITTGRVDEMFSYRAAAVFKPVKSQSYYIAYGTSFNPSAEYLALSANTIDVDPEENRIYELGAKIDVLDGRLGLRGSIFRIDKTNARTPSPDGSTVQVLQGEQRVDGFELEATGQILPGWNIFAGYTYMNSEIRKSNTAAEVGKKMPSTPEHSASLWTTYDITPRWQIGGGIFYQSKVYANATNANSVDGWVRTDLTAAYKITDAVELRLNVFNVFDEEYAAQVYPGHSVPAPGRTFMLTTRVVF